MHLRWLFGFWTINSTNIDQFFLFPESTGKTMLIHFIVFTQCISACQMAIKSIHETCLTSIGLCWLFHAGKNMRNLVGSKLWWVTFSFEALMIKSLKGHLTWNLPVFLFYLTKVGQSCDPWLNGETDDPKMMVWAWLCHPPYLVAWIWRAVSTGGGIYCLRRNAVGYGLYQALRGLR